MFSSSFQENSFSFVHRSLCWHIIITETRRLFISTFFIIFYCCIFAYNYHKKKKKKKCAGEHIKLCRQETNTHAIQFDIVSESFHIGTGRYSRNMRAWMTTTIMLKVVMTTRIIASIKLRTNPLYQTLLMIEQWMILYLVCRFW